MYKLLLSITVCAAIALTIGGFRRPTLPVAQSTSVRTSHLSAVLPSRVPNLSQPSPGSGFAVVELFTSEGCSSCPAADETLARVAREYPENVFVLGFHVDYWDRLGWKDVYSSADYTNRQREYAQQFNLNSIYTPEVVVNGRVEFVGSDEARLRSAIKDGIAATPGGQLILTAKSEDGRNVKVSYSVTNSARSSLRLALVQSQATSQVLRGENQGRKLQHVNVVRAFQSVQLKSGPSGIANLKLPSGLLAKDCRIVGFLQDGDDRKILRAARTEIL